MNVVYFHLGRLVQVQMARRCNEQLKYSFDVMISVIFNNDTTTTTTTDDDDDDDDDDNTNNTIYIYIYVCTYIYIYI